MSSSKSEDSHLTVPMPPEKSVNKAEESRINPAYIKLEDLHCDNLVPGVTYLWVLKAGGNIVVGIEKPWVYPEAFNYDLSDLKDQERWADISRQLQSAPELAKTEHGFGHPTLGAAFSEKGEVVIGYAHLGGELRFKSDHWVLDNRSGRYGRAQETAPEHLIKMQYTLESVAVAFNLQGIDVIPQLYLKTKKKFQALAATHKKSGLSEIASKDDTPEEVKSHGLG